VCRNELPWPVLFGFPSKLRLKLFIWFLKFLNK
jgi:hypothetical protein